MANSEAVAWYVEEAQRLLEEQQRRAESLRTRGGQIAGFGALFLALPGGNAARLLEAADGSVRTGIAVMLIAAALSLVVSVAMAVIGVNRQGLQMIVSAHEVGQYLTEPFLDAPELWRVQVRALRTSVKAIEFAQKVAMMR